MYNSRSSLSRNDVTPYGQMNWPMNNREDPLHFAAKTNITTILTIPLTSSDMMASNQAYNYTPHEHDSRLSVQSPYPVHTSRQSPAERLPPLSIPQQHREERWQNSQYIPTAYHAGPNMHPISPSTNVRSPISFSSNHDTYYDHADAYPSSVESRHMHPLNTIQQDAYLPQGISDHGGWGPTMTRTETHGVSPYSRHAADSIASGRSPSSDSPVDFPAVKKKRKRADAAQLKILNEVFDRTAFPTTEERQELAKKLDMTPRSVQIWYCQATDKLRFTDERLHARFQNKRQEAQQSRFDSNISPPTAHHPYGDLHRGDAGQDKADGGSKYRTSS